MVGTYESDGIHGGRTIVDFELGVNTGFNTIVTELITFRSNNKVLSDMIYAGFVSTRFLKAKAGDLSSPELFKNKRATSRKVDRRKLGFLCRLIKSANIG